MEWDLVEVRVGVDGLAIGMYVSRLDRPWLETPLPFQGFKITSPRDIERVKQYCRYVYVDVIKGIAPTKEYRISGDRSETSESLINPYRRLRRMVYVKSSGLEEELPKAKKLYEEFGGRIKEVMDDISAGKLIEVSSINKGVNALLDGVIRNPTSFLWVNRIKTSDNYTYNHLITTAIWCAVFGRHMGLRRSSLVELTLGGLLCDIGKARISTELLHKPERLTEEEFELVRMHVDYGVRILVKAGNIPHNVLRIVATHHERWNGKGYPQELREKEIPVFGRIVGLVDSFTAMTAPRPFSPGKSPHEAVSEFYTKRGTYFEADLVEEFIRACGIYPTGSLVELNTGEVAIVIGLEGEFRLRPKILVLLDEEKKPRDGLRIIDLSSSHEEVCIKKGLAPGAYGINMEKIALV